jgi:hypothetical protein
MSKGVGCYIQRGNAVSPTPETIENIEKGFAKEASERAIVHASKAAAAIVPHMDAANNIVPFARRAAENSFLTGSEQVFSGLGQAVQSPANAVGMIALPAQIAAGLGWLTQKIPAVSNRLNGVADMLNAPWEWMRHTPASKAHTVVSSGLEKASIVAEAAGKKGIAEAVARHANSARNIESTIASHASTFAQKAVEKAANTFSKVEVTAKVGEHSKSLGGASLGKAVTSAHAGVGNILKNENLLGFSYKAGAMFGSVAQTVGTAHTFKERLDQLAELCADIQGYAPESVSPMKILFAPKEKLPLLVAQERDKIRNSMAPAALMQAVNAVVSFKMAEMFSGMSNSLQGGLGIMGMQGVAHTLTGVFMPHSAALDLYDTMKDVYVNTGSLPKDVIAVGLATMAPSLRAVGAKNAYTQALAEEYVAAHITPAQLMQKIESGQVAEDLFRISSKVEAALLPVKQPAAQVSAVQAQGRLATPQLAAGAGVA